MAFSPFDISLPGPITVGQIKSLTHSTNAQVQPGFGSGEVSPAAMFQGDSPHSSQFQTTQLATLLGIGTNTFLNNGVWYGAANCLVPFRKRMSGGRYESGANHVAMQSGRTLLTPGSLSAQGSAAATLDVTIQYASSDGFLSPITGLTAQSLSAAVFTGEYQLARAKINGVAVPELTGIAVNPGITVVEQRVDGGPFAKNFFITQVLPTIDLTTEDIEAAISVINAAGIGTGVEIFLAKKLNGAITEDFANTVHIKISGANGLRQATQFGGQGEAISSGTIRVNPFSLVTAVGVEIT